MSTVQTQPRFDTWIKTSWADYQQAIAGLSHTIKGYYYNGHMRLEKSAVRFDQGQEPGIIVAAMNVVVIIFAVNLFVALRGIAATGLDAKIFRKTGEQDYQPDVAYYLGPQAPTIPSGTTIIDLDYYRAPDLVIEVAKTAFLEDIGTKRALYEELGVAEFWVVDVQQAQVLMYSLTDHGSQKIQDSIVLPGLTRLVLETALQRIHTTAKSQVGSWLLQQFKFPATPAPRLELS